MPTGQCPYQPITNLPINFLSNSSTSSLESNLEKRSCQTVYSIDNGIDYHRIPFASYPNHCIVYRIQSSVGDNFHSDLLFKVKLFWSANFLGRRK